MAIKTCEAPGCMTVVPPVVGKGRPRKFCVTCSPKRERPDRTLRVAPEVPDAVETPTPPAPAFAPPPLAPVAPLEELLYPATRTALEAAGMLEHWAGRAALLMAQRIDGCNIVGSPLAAMIRAHRDSMTLALADVAAEGDALDLAFARTS